MREKCVMCRSDVVVAALMICSCVNAAGCNSDESTNEPESPPAAASETWELPEGMAVIGGGLNVSPTGSHILFIANQKEKARVRSRHIILDTRSGKTRRVSSLCPLDKNDMMGGRPLGSEFSISGKYLLVNSAGIIAVVDLATKKSKTITQSKPPYLREAFWFGDNVAVSTVDFSRDAKTQPVRLFSLEGKAIRTIPVYGEIVATDRNGRFLMVLTDPDDPFRPVSASSVPEKGRVVVISAEGKKLMDLPRMQPGLAGPEVLISPNGAYAAFAMPRSIKESHEGTVTTRVVSMSDGSRRSVLAGVPLVVTNKGQLLTLESDVVASNGKDGPEMKMLLAFKVSYPDGKNEVLFEREPNIVGATIANGRLYYLSLHDNKYEISWRKFR